MNRAIRALCLSVLALPLLPLAAAAQQAAPEAPKPAVKMEIYGTLNVNLQTTRQQNVAARYAVSTDSTNIGIRGSAELVYQLSATLQCETSAALDGIGPAGICGRNSRVGIASPWGTLFYGNWDTPLKAVAYGTKGDDPFMNTDVYGYQSIMGSPGFNYRSSAYAAANAPVTVGGFDVRAGNSVAYWSPKVAGLSLKAQYSASEFATSNGVLAPQLYGAALNFDWGPLAVFAAYELHEDAAALAAANGGATAPRAFTSTAANSNTISSEDWSWRVGAGFEFGSPIGTTTVGAMFDQETLGQKTAPTDAVTEYKRWAVQGSLKHRMGNHELRGRYNFADPGDCKLAGGATCSTSGYGAQMWVVGYAYHLASTTQVYAFYAKIDNERNAQYTFTIGGAPAVAGATARGNDPDALGIGIRHAFAF